MQMFYFIPSTPPKKYFKTTVTGFVYFWDPVEMCGLLGALDVKEIFGYVHLQAKLHFLLLVPQLTTRGKQWFFLNIQIRNGFDYSRY